jgi:hypothetical protein
MMTLTNGKIISNASGGGNPAFLKICQKGIITTAVITVAVTIRTSKWTGVYNSPTLHLHSFKK